MRNHSVEISFFVPCYNEGKNVTGALNSIEWMMKGKTCSHEVLVVDDGSSDNTIHVVETYQRTHPEAPVTLYRNAKNMGLGWNYVCWAREARGCYYMLINGDNDMRAEDLSAVIEARDKADMIVPYLVNQNERPPMRRLLSQSFTLLVNLASGHQLRYYNGPVLHRRENVTSFDLKSSDYAYQAELLCWNLDRGRTFIELPFHTIVERQGNSSALRIPNATSVLRTLWRIWLAGRRRKSAKISPERKEELPVV